MASAHDTVSDVSDIGAEFDDSIDFLDQNQTAICRLVSIDRQCRQQLASDDSVDWIPQETTSRRFI